MRSYAEKKSHSPKPPWFVNERFARPWLRKKILKRDGFKCYYCGCVVTMENAHIDHLIAWSKGGKTTFRNLVASCRRCNLDKKALSPNHFDYLCEKAKMRRAEEKRGLNLTAP